MSDKAHDEMWDTLVTENVKLQAQVKELEAALKYIASNPYALDDISYCQCAGEALAERNE